MQCKMDLETIKKIQNPHRITINRPAKCGTFPITNHLSFYDKIIESLKSKPSKDSKCKRKFLHSFTPRIVEVAYDSKHIVRHRTNGFPAHEELKRLQDQVEDAVKKHKIFTVHGNHPVIRNALVDRGWIEKLNGSYVPPGLDHATMRRLALLSIPDLVVGLSNRKLAHAYRLAILSKLVEWEPVYFYWDLNRNTNHNIEEDKLRNAVVNFIERSRYDYSTKDGLYQCSKHSKCCKKPNVLYFQVPRSYCLHSSGKEELKFKKDFQITAAISLLKWIIHLKAIHTKIISDFGTLPISMFHFVLNECDKFITMLKYKKPPKEERSSISDEKWSKFLDIFPKMIDNGIHFEANCKESNVSIANKARMRLKILEKLCPHHLTDGFRNIWILKPTCGSRGVGIHFCRTIDEVISYHENNKYVIQKYIEKPLLIHDTKFDIRQWFLVSTKPSLNIWMYKECYLRLSSQNYGLSVLHESIHLTNNSVQCKYNNCSRNPHLPSHKMWYLKEFQEYLASIGHSKAYEDIIYPKMTQCIVATVLAAHDKKSDPGCRKGFELQGADFMLGEDLKPWLIKINSKPAMIHNTPVISDLCTNVLEDTMKVIIDHTKDPRASTGKFELIYKA